MRRSVLSYLFSLALLFELSACSHGPVSLGTPAGTASPSSKDVTLPDSGVRLAYGWFPLETYQGASFRWADNDVKILVCPSLEHQSLKANIEPGPSVGKKSMQLQVIAPDGSRSFDIASRSDVTIPITGARPQVLVFHVKSREIPIPHDVRRLNFRVFSLQLPVGTCGNDVISDDYELTAGKNWYDLEHQNGNLFRWVENDAKIIVTRARSGPSTLNIDAEPGPSLAGRPLILSLEDAAGRRLISGRPLNHRDYITLRVPPLAAGETLSLHAQTPGFKRAVPGDSRTLNFRVFDLHLQ